MSLMETGEVGADETDTVETPVVAIDVEGVSVRLGEIAAVRDLSLHVPPGAIYGLVGPSGAGKTTVMRVLATLQRPGNGTVRIDGIDMRTDVAAIRARVGYLPDASGMYDAFTTREYLIFYGALFRLPARERRRSADELLELFGLEKQRNSPVGALPRGMRQQLGVARCLIHDPSVLLLDEPVAGMDPQARLDLYDIVRELSRLGKTIVISTHLLADLADVCTHLGVLKKGRLLMEGEMAELVPSGRDLETVYLQLTGDAVDEQAM